MGPNSAAKKPAHASGSGHSLAPANTAAPYAETILVFDPEGHKNRTTSVLVSPQLTVGQVIKTVCSEWKLDAAMWGLRPRDAGEKAKTLARALLIRFASFKLSPAFELVLATASNAPSPGGTNSQAPRTVLVGLQLDNGTRLKEPISNSATLWTMLQHFEQKHISLPLNLVRRYQSPSPQRKKSFFGSRPAKSEGGGGIYLVPILTYASRQINETVQDLQAITLISLGVTENVLLRVEFKPSLILEEQNEPAESSLSGRTSAILLNPAVPATTPTVGQLSMPTPTSTLRAPADSCAIDTDQNAKAASDLLPAGETEMENPTTTMSKIEQYSAHEVGGAPLAVTAGGNPLQAQSNEMISAKPLPASITGREITLYGPSQADGSEGQIDTDTDADEASGLSVTELMYHLGQEKKRRDALEKERLMTRSMRKDAAENQKSLFPTARIRVRFHDAYRLEFTVLSSEHVAVVAEVFKSALRYVPEGVKLCLPSPTGAELPDTGTVWDARLAPQSVLFCSEKVLSTVSYVDADLVQKCLAAQSIPPAELRRGDFVQPQTQTQTRQSQVPELQPKTGLSTLIPKWLRK